MINGVQWHATSALGETIALKDFVGKGDVGAKERSERALRRGEGLMFNREI
jgi:hypothetical protein